jgi:hypothetical protein
LYLRFFFVFFLICKMPPKKAAPAPKQIFSKESFFQPKRTLQDIKKAPEDPKQEIIKPVDVRPRRFLFEKDTGVAYAEVVDGTAVSLDTGEVLFRFGGSAREEYPQQGGFIRQHDFSPPMGTRHPDDPFVDVLNLVKAGILTDAEVASQKAFSREELACFMKKLELYHMEMERMCGEV